MSKVMSKVDVYEKYVFGEMSKNKKFDIEDLDHFVKSLSASQAKLMCKYWSTYRKNSVYDFISRGPSNWKSVTVDIGNLCVEKVNESVNTLLEKNEWSLEKIVKDEEIILHKEFKSQGEIDLRLMIFIAKKTEDKYILVDGIHRAIRLGLDGRKEFQLMYY